MSRLLVLGAGWEQRPLIERARADGFDVVGAGPEGSESAPLVSQFSTTDPRNLPGLLGLARRCRVDAVVSDQDDYARYAQAWLSERLGLPGPRLDAVAPTVMKHWLRELCAEARVPQPDHRLTRGLSEAREAAKQLRWPVIVKPVDNRGSFGVVRVDEPDQLDEAVSDAFAHAHSRAVLVEEFIDGTVVTVDGAHMPTGHRILGIASKRQVGGRRQVAMEVCYPAQLGEEAIRRAIENADKVASVLAALGATGLTHTEFVYDGTEMWLLETANRGGGVYTSNVIIPAHSKFDTNGFLLAEATGQPPDSDGMRGAGDAVILSFFGLPRGRIAAISGMEKICSSVGVLRARLNVQPGDNVTEVETAVSRAGFIIVAGRHIAEARARLNDALKQLDVRYH